MTLSATWRRLDVHGRDTVHLLERGKGWRMTGTAVFAAETGSVSVAYEVDLAPDWRTERGRISGYSGDKTFRHEFARHSDGWTMDGTHNGLEHLEDLDFGFTPATTYQQLKRLNLITGRSAGLPVAWFDLGAAALVELPQHYKRLDASRYAYDAPSVPYAGTLALAETGFVKTYPGLWELETDSPPPS